MKSTTMAIFGGLLKGVGSGMQADYDERRKLALANLQRQWDQQDAAAKSAAELAKEDRQHANKLVEIEKGGEVQRKNIAASGQETRTTQREKSKLDLNIEKVKSQLRRSEDKERQLLADRLGDDDVQSVQTAEDGSLVVVKKNGSLVTTGVKLHIKEDSDKDEEGGTIDAARERRGGGGKAPAAAATETSGEANRMRTLYANATPQKAPRLFRNGQKIPYDEFERLMKGGQ